MEQWIYSLCICRNIYHLIFFFLYQNNQYTSKRNLFSDLPLQSNSNVVDKTAEFRVPLKPESITPNPNFKPNVKKILKTRAGGFSKGIPKELFFIKGFYSWSKKQSISIAIAGIC